MTDRGKPDLNRRIHIEHHISHMTSLSTTFSKVTAICNDPGASPNDLGRVISLDPVLVGKLLQLINSAYYSLPGGATSTTRAIVLLGLNTVKNLVLSTAILDAVGSTGSLGDLSMEDFWVHSLCVGVTAKALAERHGVPVSRREEYFVAGLLHDLGKIPLGRVFPDDYRAAQAVAMTEGIPLEEAEERLLGINHTVVGKMIARKWQLDEALTCAIACHHDIDPPREEAGELAALVTPANLLANAFGIGSGGDEFAPERREEEILRHPGMSLAVMEDMRDIICKDIERAKIFLSASEGKQG